MDESVGRDRTLTMNDLASLSGGRPSSVTRTVNWFVVLASESEVAHVSTPFVALIVDVGGAPGSRLKVTPFAGISGSVAELEIVRMDPTWSARLATGARIGGAFVSSTYTVNICVDICAGGPGSMIYTIIKFVLGPCNSVGVQVNKPLVGSIIAPAGALVARL